jgi:YVTN family beta-propeller protein
MAGRARLRHLWRRNRHRSGRRAAGRLVVCALVASGLVSLGALTTTESGHNRRSSSTASFGGKEALASVLEAVGQAPAVPPSDRLVGVAAATSPMKLDVVLQPRQPAALASFATAVSTPGNALYRHFLPRGRFADVFGPTPAAIAAVTSYLRRAGLDPGVITADHLMIPVTTTVGAVEQGLHVSMRLFHQPAGSGAATALVNTDAPSLPASVAADVQGIIGLDTVSSRPTGPIAARPVAHPSATPSIAAARAPQACSLAKTVGRKYGGWTETQLADAYSFDGEYAKGDLGAGTTIALFEEQTYSARDIADFQACYHTHVRLTNVSVDKGSRRDSDFSPEAALDIETAIGLAPKAALRIYETTGSGSGPTDGYDAIVTQDKAQIISSSWSTAPLNCDVFVPAAVIRAENSIFQEAAAQGQSTYVATGDVGSEGCMSNGGSYELGAGRGPAAVAVDTATQTTYVANYRGGSITVLSERSLGVVRTISLGGNTEPDGLAVDPKTGQLWVSEAGRGRVAEINGKTCDAATRSDCRVTTVADSTVANSDPDGLAVNSSTGTVYVALAGTAESAVGVISEKTRRAIGRTPAGDDPSSVAVDARTNEIYYTADNDDAVGGFSGRGCDASSLSKCPTRPSGVPVGVDPVGVTVDAATNRLYVANFDSDTVSVLNARNGDRVATVALAGHVGGPTSVAVAPGGTSLLVTGAGDGAKAGVAVVSIARRTVTRVLTGGKTPVAVGVDANDGFAWVADYGASTAASAEGPHGKGLLGVLRSTATSSAGGVVWLPLLLSVEDPAGQPFVTGVGGTNLTRLGPAPSQSVWDEPRLGEGAGTGGISSRWTMPRYQKGPGVISSLSSRAPCGARAGQHCRELPDVSASADPSHGYVIVFGGQWTVVGGTSAATPLWAAVTSILDATGGRVHRVGFLNPALYRLVGRGRRIVNDVTSGNNDYTTTSGGHYPTTRHYDMATGLGTPIVTGLAAALH